MKLLTYKFLLFIFYLLSTVISYSTEQPNIKNLIVHSDGKKLKNIEFKNNFDEVIRLNDYRGKLVILNLDKDRVLLPRTGFCYPGPWFGAFKVLDNLLLFVLFTQDPGSSPQESHMVYTIRFTK